MKPQISELTDMITLGDTYGYFSLGNIILDQKEIPTSFNLFYGFQGECTIGGNPGFTVYLYKTGLLNQYLVLADFSRIPDIAVIQSEEILGALKEKLLEKIKAEEYNSTWSIPRYSNISPYDKNSIFTSTSTTY